MRRFVDLFQRIFQLTIGDFQLGEFKDQRVTALQQGVQQFTLGAQLGLKYAILLAGERLTVKLMELAQLRLFVQQIFITQAMHTQLRHFGIQLLRLRHFRQARNLSTQRLTE